MRNVRLKKLRGHQHHPVTVVRRGAKGFAEVERAIKGDARGRGGAWNALCRNAGALALSPAFKNEVFGDESDAYAEWILYCGTLRDITGFAIACEKEIRSDLPPGKVLEFNALEFDRADEGENPFAGYKIRDAKTGRKIKYTTNAAEAAWERWRRGKAKHERESYPHAHSLYVPAVCASRGQGAPLFRAVEALAAQLRLPSISLRASSSKLVDVYRRYGFSKSAGCEGDGLSSAARARILAELNMRENDEALGPYFGVFMSRCTRMK